jgi:hypothetical protein
MSGTTASMKKKEDIAGLISNILEQAARTRKGFTPDVVDEFYEEGLRASQRREEPVARRPDEDRAMREVTPSRQLGNIVAFRRREEAQSRTELSPEMKRQAIEESVRLGEMMELAVSGRRSDRQWATG